MKKKGIIRERRLEKGELKFPFPLGYIKDKKRWCRRTLTLTSQDTTLWMLYICYIAHRKIPQKWIKKCSTL
ncbi:MAG: hypothetical protein HXS54_10755 [Theionarchaea archaeon]|nr:hypothetical protein [Theionarchaea archaeon]